MPGGRAKARDPAMARKIAGPAISEKAVYAFRDGGGIHWAILVNSMAVVCHHPPQPREERNKSIWHMSHETQVFDVGLTAGSHVPRRTDVPWSRRARETAKKAVVLLFVIRVRSECRGWFCCTKPLGLILNLLKHQFEPQSNPLE